MLAEKKRGLLSGRRVHGAGPRRILVVFLAALLMIPFHSVSAAARTMSGTTQLSNSLQYGTTAYSVDYSYPSTAEVGSNLTITVILHVKSLTGLTEYVNQFRLVANVYVGSQHVLNGSVDSGVQPLFLRQGAAWGPEVISIPLTSGNTGLANGVSANATVSFTLADTIYAAGPVIAQYVTEPPMQGAAGGLLIENAVTTATTGNTTGQGASQTFLPYALLATGAVLMLLAVFFPRASRPSQ